MGSVMNWGAKGYCLGGNGDREGEVRGEANM